jgi:hypothetical protein
MERFPVGNWEFARPGVLRWSGILSNARQTDGVLRACERLLQLENRLRRVAGKTVGDEELEEEGDEALVVEEVEEEEAVDEEEAEEEAEEEERFVENDPPVSTFLSCIPC